MKFGFPEISAVNMNQTTYQMNRHENNNNNNESRNPFQRNGRSNGYSNGNNRGGYNDWKRGGSVPYSAYGSAPVKPKEKVLTADDFPALPTATASAKHIPDKNVWGSKDTKATPKPKDDDSDSDSEAPPTTLADRVKEVIAKEEEARLRGVPEKEKEEDLYVIPISNWLRSKHLAKEREEEMKRREWEAEEANYRWQISRQMFPPKPEPSMTEYDEEFYEEGFGDGGEALEELVDER